MEISRLNNELYQPVLRCSIRTKTPSHILDDVSHSVESCDVALFFISEHEWLEGSVWIVAWVRVEKFSRHETKNSLNSLQSPSWNCYPMLFRWLFIVFRGMVHWFAVASFALSQSWGDRVRSIWRWPHRYSMERFTFKCVWTFVQMNEAIYSRNDSWAIKTQPGLSSFLGGCLVARWNRYRPHWKEMKSHLVLKRGGHF